MSLPFLNASIHSWRNLVAQQISDNSDAVRYAANIPKYYLYAVLVGFAIGFILAVWVLYLQQRRGLSLTEITIADIAFWITTTLSEVPTGVVADTLGRKTSIAIGMGLLGVSVLAWGM